MGGRRRRGQRVPGQSPIFLKSGRILRSGRVKGPALTTEHWAIFQPALDLDLDVISLISKPESQGTVIDLPLKDIYPIFQMPANVEQFVIAFHEKFTIYAVLS